MNLPQPDNSELENLLKFLKHNRGFDFSGYKRASLARRINRRMQTVDVEGYTNYIDYLEVHPEEFTHLFDTILINLTGFFRDQEAWEYLQHFILPDILSTKGSQDNIRVWSSGCSSGEEAFSIAMLLADVIGEQAFRERVKIYATDIDEDALAKARQATYFPKDLEPIPEELREKYFSHINGCYIFNKDLRRCVIFGRNDLIQDAPISRIDLLICRNLLMYFNAETQSRIVSRFHFALRDEGYLFLGKAEMLLTHSNLFSPENLKLRLFRKTPQVNLRDRLLIMAQTGQDIANHTDYDLIKLRELMIDGSPLARIAIDMNNNLVLANTEAKRQFNISDRDIGHPFQDLDIYYRSVELGSTIERVRLEQIPLIIKSVEWPNNNRQTHFYDILLHPLIDENQAMLGVSLTFEDMTAQRHLQLNLEEANHELETAFEELQSTNEELETTNEELETTNEELETTNEELETTNEELQSTNEELETMNEELQSTNEELHTMNDELRYRTDEINRVNAFLESILTNIQSGVVVLQRDLGILMWNKQAEDLWGLREAEVLGKNFLNLDIGLPVEQLIRELRSCLEGMDCQKEIILPARNRRGRDIRCSVSIGKLNGPRQEILGLIILMDELVDR